MAKQWNINISTEGAFLFPCFKAEIPNHWTADRYRYWASLKEN